MQTRPETPANAAAAPARQDKSRWPRLADIPEPRMVCFGAGNGSGSKLFQAYLDGHPQVLMLPAYPLMYFYPHWRQWQEELKNDWTWAAIIDAFCIKHASVIDSRRIPGHDGLTTLGENREQWVELDEDLFRAFLAHLVDGQPIVARTMLLAAHYAYAFCRDEDLMKKTVLVYHIHVHEYVPRYLAPDFPDMLTLGFVRDPRSNLRGRYESVVNMDRNRLNRTDWMIYARRNFYVEWRFFVDSLERFRNLDPARVRVVRHEDMHYRLEELMRETASFLGIDFHPCLLDITFGGLTWWGEKVYDMKPMNKPNPRVVSLEWQQTLPVLDWYVLEGLFFDYCRKYGYTLYKYRRDGMADRALLFLAMLLPTVYERRIFRAYTELANWRDFFRSACNEATGRTPLKDYTFNAYYRHKWSNAGLNLWKPRWFLRFLTAAREHGAALPLYRLAQVNYVVINLARYAVAPALSVLVLGKRMGLSMAAYFRRILRTEILPEPLVQEPPPVGKAG